MSVLVVLEQNGGKWNRMSFEALAAGKRIAEALAVPLQAVVLGAAVDALAKEAAAYPVEKVIAINHTLLGHYTPDGYTAALEQLINASKTEAVVFPHTYQVRDYAPKLATRFAQPFVSDVVDMTSEGGKLSFVRQLFQGRLSADVVTGGEPRFVSVQAGAFRAAEASGAHSRCGSFRARIRRRQNSQQARRSLPRSAAFRRSERRRTHRLRWPRH